MTYHDQGGEGGKSKYDEDMGGTGNSKSDIDFGGRGMIKNDQNMFLKTKDYIFSWTVFIWTNNFIFLMNSLHMLNTFINNIRLEIALQTIKVFFSTMGLKIWAGGGSRKNDLK